MNKAFKVMGNTLFIINALILFIFYTNILYFSFTKVTICSVVVLILLILNFIQIKNNDNITNDKKYNIMVLLVNIIVLIIFLRDKFDLMIPLGSAHDTVLYSTSSNGLFIDYNIISITIMYTGILIYNLLNKGKLKCSNKKN